MILKPTPGNFPASASAPARRRKTQGAPVDGAEATEQDEDRKKDDETGEETGTGSAGGGTGGFPQSNETAERNLSDIFTQSVETSASHAPELTIAKAETGQSLLTETSEGRLAEVPASRAPELSSAEVETRQSLTTAISEGRVAKATATAATITPAVATIGMLVDNTPTPWTQAASQLLPHDTGTLNLMVQLLARGAEPALPAILPATETWAPVHMAAYLAEVVARHGTAALHVLAEPDAQGEVPLVTILRDADLTAILADILPEPDTRARLLLRAATHAAPDDAVTLRAAAHTMLDTMIPVNAGALAIQHVSAIYVEDNKVVAVQDGAVFRTELTPQAFDAWRDTLTLTPEWVATPDQKLLRRADIAMVQDLDAGTQNVWLRDSSAPIIVAQDVARPLPGYTVVSPGMALNMQAVATVTMDKTTARLDVGQGWVDIPATPQLRDTLATRGWVAVKPDLLVNPQAVTSLKVVRSGKAEATLQLVTATGARTIESTWAQARQLVERIATRDTALVTMTEQSMTVLDTANVASLHLDTAGKISLARVDGLSPVKMPATPLKALPANWARIGDDVVVNLDKTRAVEIDHKAAVLTLFYGTSSEKITFADAKDPDFTNALDLIARNPRFTPAEEGRVFVARDTVRRTRNDGERTHILAGTRNFTVTMGARTRVQFTAALRARQVTVTKAETALARGARLFAATRKTPAIAIRTALAQATKGKPAQNARAIPLIKRLSLG